MRRVMFCGDLSLYVSNLIFDNYQNQLDFNWVRFAVLQKFQKY